MPDGALAVSVAELGYYEAELTNLHDAAVTLAEVEKQEGGREGSRARRLPPARGGVV